MSGISNVQALADLLRSFAEQLAANRQAIETVCVEIERHGFFRNEAVTRANLGITIDEPSNFGGTGQAPDPAEYLLAAVGASLSVTLTAHAALRGVTLEAVAVRLVGAIHGPSFFLPEPNMKPGILDITIDLIITTKLSRQVIENLVQVAVAAAPVLQTLKEQPRITLILKSDD